jgi:hypothetical protein
MDIRLFNTMDAGFCVDCLEEAIKAYGRPEIFNSGQGSQLTSDCFAGVLIPKNDITIGMDERCRALDNIFVESLHCIYELKSPSHQFGPHQGIIFISSIRVFFTILLLHCWVIKRFGNLRY